MESDRGKTDGSERTAVTEMQGGAPAPTPEVALGDEVGRGRVLPKRGVRLTAKVGPNMLAQLDRIALNQGRSRAQLVREAVMWFCFQALNDIPLPETLVLDYPLKSNSPGPNPRWQVAASFGLDEASSEALLEVARQFRVSKGSVVREALGCWLAERLTTAPSVSMPKVPLGTPARSEPLPAEPWPPAWLANTSVAAKPDKLELPEDGDNEDDRRLVTTGSHRRLCIDEPDD